MSNLSGKTQIERAAGVLAAACQQCNRCTAGCPMAEAMDIKPAQVVHLLRLGKEDRVLSSKSIWLCISCQTCTSRCPQEVDVDRLMLAARVISRDLGVAAEVTGIQNFLDSYMENMYLYGRLGEVPLLATLKIKEQNFFDDLVLGAKLFWRGRLSLVDLPEGSDTYRELYKRTLKKEKRE